MPKQIITSPDAPTTGFTDKSIPSPLAQAIRALQQQADEETRLHFAIESDGSFLLDAALFEAVAT